MSTYRKYTKIRSVYGELSLVGIVPNSASVPEESPAGSIFYVQDTSTLIIHTGSEWTLLGGSDYVDAPVISKYTDEELDYINNIKPFLSFIGGEVVKDKIDLVRGLLRGKRYTESSRFNLFS